MLIALLQVLTYLNHNGVWYNSTLLHVSLNLDILETGAWILIQEPAFKEIGAEAP